MGILTEDAELLDNNKRETFHSVTAKLLHIMKRGRPDLEILVSFLTMRVTKMNLEYWKKLKRSLTYVLIGIKLYWEYVNRTVTLSIPNYVRKSLHIFQHIMMGSRE